MRTKQKVWIYRLAGRPEVLYVFQNTDKPIYEMGNGWTYDEDFNTYRRGDDETLRLLEVQ